MKCVDQNWRFVWGEQGSEGETLSLAWAEEEVPTWKTQEWAIGETGTHHFHGRKPLAPECIMKNTES